MVSRLGLHNLSVHWATFDLLKDVGKKVRKGQLMIVLPVSIAYLTDIVMTFKGAEYSHTIEICMWETVCVYVCVVCVCVCLFFNGTSHKKNDMLFWWLDFEFPLGRLTVVDFPPDSQRKQQIKNKWMKRRAWSIYQCEIIRMEEKNNTKLCK